MDICRMMQIVQPNEFFFRILKIDIGTDAPAVFQITAIKKTRFNQTFAQAYESTYETIIHMRRAGYEVREMWECDFERLKKQQPEIER